MKKINKSLIVTVLAIAFVLIGLTGPSTVSGAGPAAVDLLSADNFVILSKTGITNTGSHASLITGNIGSSPITAAAMNNVFCSEIVGTIYGVDAGYVGSGDQTCFAGNPPLANKTLVDNAILDMGTAYNAAAAVTGPDGTELYAGNLGGQTFAPGLYKWSTDVTIPTNVTLSGGANDVWIFQIAGDLSIASGGSIPAGIKVVLSGGAVASNVFWQVGGPTGATLGTYSTFNGNILSAKQVIIQTGAVLNGRAFADTQVTLDANTVSVPAIVVPPIPPPVPPPVVSSPATQSMPVPPLIDLEKVPSPLALPSGPGPVAYTYTVRNVGYVEMTNITLVDEKCNPTYVSGDIDNDSKLDIPEAWVYRCSTVLSQTTTNTATAIGRHPSNGGTATDIAIATVAVGLPTPPPLIHIVKKTTSLNLLFGGGAMTYTYTVTNPGIAPLTDVSVTDDKCAGLPGRVLGHPGDLNKNNLLESNESWTFTCQTNLTKTTTNTATARGSANGFNAIDVALATVVVAPPGLPSTGNNPDGSNILWQISAGALIAVSILFYVARRKQVVN